MALSAIITGAVVIVFLLLQPILLRISCYERCTRPLRKAAIKHLSSACCWRLYWTLMLKSKASSAAYRRCLLACIQSAFERAMQTNLDPTICRLGGHARCKSCTGRLPCAAAENVAHLASQHANTSLPYGRTGFTVYSASAQSAVWAMVLERRRQSELMVPTFTSPSPLLHTAESIRESMNGPSEGCCSTSLSLPTSGREGHHALHCGHCQRMFHAGCLRQYLHRALFTSRSRHLHELQELLLKTGSPPCHICCERADSRAVAAHTPSSAPIVMYKARARKVPPRHIAVKIDDMSSLNSSTDFVPVQQSPKSKTSRQRTTKSSRSPAKVSPTVHAHSIHDVSAPPPNSAAQHGVLTASTVGDPSSSRQPTAEL